MLILLVYLDPLVHLEPLVHGCIPNPSTRLYWPAWPSYSGWHARGRMNAPVTFFRPFRDRAVSRDACLANNNRIMYARTRPCPHYRRTLLTVHARFVPCAVHSADTVDLQRIC